MKTSRLIEQNVSLIRTTATAHHYTLKTQIGHGGFSAVFLAHSEYYDQDFVIKVSLRSFENVSNRSGNHNFQALRNDQHNNRNCNQANNSKDTNMNSLEKENTYCLTPQETKEIEALKGLNHPNIIKIFEYFVDDRFLYMVLENCPYGSLSDYIRRNGAIKPPVLYNCIGQSILALYHCHSHKIAHRDIKPANLLIDQYGRIKLADFGLSSKYEEGQNSSEYSGSKPYMAPELFLRTEHDPFLADIWSLGVTFYQMVSGELPWSTGSPKEMEMAISMGMVSFTSLNLPCELVTMIRGMIEVNVDRRITLDEIIKGPFFTCFILNKSTQNTFSVPGENDSNEIENNNAKSPIPISKSLNITRACSNKIKHQFVDTLHKTGECNGSLNNDDKNKQHVSSIINNAFKGAHPLLQPYSSFTGCNSFHTSSNSFSNQIAPNQPLLKKGLKSGSIGPIKKGEVGKIGAKAGILAIPDCAPKKVLPGNRSVLAFQAIPLIQSGLRMNSSKAHLPVSLKAFLES